MPTIWMMRNPFKILEFFQVVGGSGLRGEHVVLDLGCGKGFQTQVLARSCRKVIGIDPSRTAISEARRFLRHSPVQGKVDFLACTLEDAQLSPLSLDRVYSFCVLEHISNLAEVLVEIVRLLKPGGELHISVDSLAPIQDPELLEKHKREHHVVTYFSPESLRHTLQAAGLEVRDVFPILTSDFARQEFEARIRQTSYERGLMSRILLYKRLRDEDKRSRSNQGIMLVGRACRPVALPER